MSDNEKTTDVPNRLDGLVRCPACGTLNNDDWPIEVAGKIVQGGCQECWEKECDASWWKTVIALDKMQANDLHQSERGTGEHNG